MNTPQVADLLRYSLQQGQQPFVTITSGSMAPLLRRGDQVQVEAATWQALQPGDVVLVQAAVDLLTHRYWGSVQQEESVWLLLRGDRPLDFDGLLPASNLIGRVIRRRRQRHLLHLQHGAGGWLNRHLALLSRCEIRLLGPTTATHLRRRQGAARIIRQALYAWAVLLAKLVTVTASLRMEKEFPMREAHYDG